MTLILKRKTSTPSLTPRDLREAQDLEISIQKIKSWQISLRWWIRSFGSINGLKEDLRYLNIICKITLSRHSNKDQTSAAIPFPMLISRGSTRSPTNSMKISQSLQITILRSSLIPEQLIKANSPQIKMDSSILVSESFTSQRTVNRIRGSGSNKLRMFKILHSFQIESIPISKCQTSLLLTYHLLTNSPLAKCSKIISSMIPLQIRPRT